MKIKELLYPLLFELYIHIWDIKFRISNIYTE